MNGGYACVSSRCSKHDVPMIATVTDSVYCDVCEHAEAERLREELHEAGDGDTWRAACLRVTAELEIAQQRLAAAEAECERLQDKLVDLRKSIAERDGYESHRNVHLDT